MSGSETPAGVQLVIKSEKERVRNKIEDRIAWLATLGITDERQILNYLSLAPATDILVRNSLPGAPSAEIFDAVRRYGAQYNISPQTLLDIIAFETGGTFDPSSKNPSSSALGLFQFTTRTWNEVGRKNEIDGVNVFTDPTNLDQNIHAGAIFVSQTVRTLSRLGIEDPTEDQIYLAHNQGAGGAAALLKNPEMNVVDALNTLADYHDNPGKAEMAIRLNGGNRNMRADQFVTALTSRFLATAKRTPRIVE